MLYSPTAQIKVVDYSLVEAHLNTGRFCWMDIIARRWALLVQETLYAELRVMCEVEAKPVIWIRFEDLLREVQEMPIFIFDINRQGKGLFLFEKGFVRFITSPRDKEGSHSNVHLEELMKNHQKRLLSLVRPMMQDFEKSWLKIGSFQLELKRITTHPKRAQVMLPFERCLLVRVQLRVGEINTELTLCLPFSELQSQLTVMEDKRVLAPESLEHYHERLEQTLLRRLCETEHTVTAELGSVDLRKSGGRLQEGDVLPVDTNGKVTLSINGEASFQGPLGASAGKYSVQVSNRIPRKKPSAVKQDQEFETMQWSSAS